MCPQPLTFPPLLLHLSRLPKGSRLLQKVYWITIQPRTQTVSLPFNGGSGQSSLRLRKNRCRSCHPLRLSPRITDATRNGINRSGRGVPRAPEVSPSTARQRPTWSDACAARSMAPPQRSASDSSAIMSFVPAALQPGRPPSHAVSISGSFGHDDANTTLSSLLHLQLRLKAPCRKLTVLNFQLIPQTNPFCPLRHSAKCSTVSVLAAYQVPSRLFAMKIFRHTRSLFRVRALTPLQPRHSRLISRSSPRQQRHLGLPHFRLPNLPQNLFPRCQCPRYSQLVSHNPTSRNKFC